MSTESEQAVLETWRFAPAYVPRVYIEPETWCAIHAAALVCPVEISLFCHRQVLPQNVLYVSCAHIFPQECSLNDTSTFRSSFRMLTEELPRIGEDPRSHKCWVHSHVWSKTYASATDMRAIETLKSIGRDGGPPWKFRGLWVSIVVNKFGQAFCRVDIAEPNYGWEHVPLSLGRKDASGNISPVRLTPFELHCMLLDRTAAIANRVKECVTIHPEPPEEPKKP